MPLDSLSAVFKMYKKKYKGDYTDFHYFMAFDSSLFCMTAKCPRSIAAQNV